LKYIKYLSLIAIIIIIAALFTSCEKENTSVIDPILTFPTILGTMITPTVFDTSDINGIAWAEVTSEEAVTSVTVSVKNPLNTEIGIFSLKDDGTAPDIIAGDGRYTGYITFSMTCRIVGQYKGEFIAKNVSGLTSSLITENFNVINSNNQPPVISDLVIVPDSIQVNNQAFFIFMVTAVDPDGSCDINQVYYDGFDPLGGTLTRRILFDDGSCCPVENTGVTSGDSTANDTKFTRKLFGAPDKVGYYKYFIKAEDNSGASSNILSDSIYVYQ
jgi:hypothetical protein